MIIKRETLQAVRPAISGDDTRYALYCVQVEPNGACVATNGHILIKATETDSRFPDADFPTIAGVPEPTHDPTAPIVVPADMADRLIKGTAKKATIPILQAIRVVANGDGSHYAMSTDLSVPTVARMTADDLKERSFPAYDRLIPDADRPAVRVGIGVPVLEALIKSAKAIGATCLEFSIPTDDSAKSKQTSAVTSVFTVKYKSTSAGVECFVLAMPFAV